MSRLKLAVLGPPEISLDGAPVNLDRQKAVALLAYLALTGRRHSRESLAALLWPDLEPARAFAALRQALWALNTALGPAWLDSDRAGVALHPGAPLELDAGLFRAELAAARQADDPLPALRSAVARYRGDLLAGLELRDSAPFGEWQFFEAEAYRRELAEALETLAEQLGARGAYAEAAGYARRRVALDPLHEPAHRALMRLYTAAGQRAAALRQFDELARLLASELDAQPEPETLALFETIRAGRVEGRRAGGQSGERAGEQERRGVGEQEVAVPRTRPLTHAPSARLPTPATPFVGREAELEQLAGLLADPACRMVTLLGPGGIGKTRLALEAARRSVERFPDGVCFVSLSSVADSALIYSTVAEALGLDLFRREGVRGQLFDYLRPRTMLLVADNLEQLAGGAEQFAELLEAAPALKLIATSRERLGLIAEWPVVVGGLELPAGDTGDSAAVQLFLQGMRRALAGRSLEAEAQAQAAQICRLVGGVPLAIELAAAWTRLMPLAAIGAAIRQDLDFLAGAAPGLPERHRGLRAVFEHSWRLLDPIDQGAFKRVAVFRGSFTREAVAAVLGGPTWSVEQRSAMAAIYGGRALPSDQQVAVAALAALADRSLIRQVAADRFEIHELLRQYAAERLAGDLAEQAAARAAHAAHFLGILQHSEAALKGNGQQQAIAALEADLDNLRAAWRHAVQTQDWVGLAAAQESLFVFYETRSLFEEGEDMFGRAATAAAQVADPPEQVIVLLTNLLARQGWFALRLYRFEPARALLGWSMELIERHGPRRETMVAELIATSPTLTGGFLRSESRLGQQLERIRASGDSWVLAQALNAYAWTRATRAEVYDVLKESLAVSRAAGNQHGVAGTLDDLGTLVRGDVRLAQAIAYWEEALELYERLGYRWAHAYCQDKLGYAWRQRGDLERAERLHRASLEGSRAIGDRLGVAGSLDNLARVALDRGDVAAAEELARQGLAVRQQVGHGASTVVSLLTLARIAVARGDGQAALALLDEAQSMMPWDQEWMYARALRLRARVAMARDDLETATVQLRTALDLTAETWDRLEQVMALGDLAEALLAAGDAALAAELAAVALQGSSEMVRLRQNAEAILARTGPPARIRPLGELIEALRV